MSREHLSRLWRLNMSNTLAINLMDSIITSDMTNVTFSLVISILLSSFVFGAILSILYVMTNRRDGYSKGMSYTLIMLPSILAILCVVSSNLSGAGNSSTALSAISIGGALTIIRFRSTQGSPKDLAYIFAALTLGLACGRGFIAVAAILDLFMVIVMVVLMFVKFGDARNPKKLLKITIPESLNYVGVFDEILAKYTTQWSVVKIKSSNFGTMFELRYAVNFKKDVNTKEMFDEIRCLNGNLDISLENYVYDVMA